MSRPPSEYELTMQELQSADDRSLAIVGGAVVEDALQFAIAQALNVSADTPEHKMLFRGNGPLKNNSDKIAMVTALKLVGPNTRRDLDQIASIRNLFAHRLSVRSFEAPAAAELVRCLRYRGKVPDPAPRERFRLALLTIIHALDMSSLGFDETETLD